MGNSSSTDEIKLGDRIGEGAYGEVFRAEWRKQIVAAKRIRPIFFENDYYGVARTEFIRKFKAEWELLETLKHPNIVEYFTVIVPPTKEPPIIVTELLDCDLASYIRKKKRISFPETVQIMIDVAEGLRYLHLYKKPAIVHRDLASKNILLTHDRRAKIADLGLAKAFPTNAMMATCVPGTPIYAAPETYPERLGHRCFRSKAHYTAKIDIFSFGAMLLEVIVGHLPNSLPDPVSEDGEVLPEYIRRSADLEEMGPSHPLRDLVFSCLDNDPRKRPNAEEALEQLKMHRTPVELKVSSKDLERNPPSISRISSEGHFDYKFKIIVLGESDVGKSTIIYRFIKPNAGFPSVMLPVTVALADYHERLQVRGKWIHLHLVDTAGTERFHNVSDLMPQIYREADGAVVVYDVSSRLTFLQTRKWVKLVRGKLGDSVPIVLVGNKVDEANREVDSLRAEEYANTNNLFYIETSAKSRTNIDEIFSVLIELLMQRKGEKIPPFPVSKLERSVAIESSITQRSFSSPRPTLSPGGILLENEMSVSRGGISNGGDELDHGSRKGSCCPFL